MNLTRGDPQSGFPFVQVADLRQKFDNGTKIGFAVGGWDKTTGFNETLTPNGLQDFVNNTAKFAESIGADFVDIDWEYPGGDGIDYLQKNANSKQTEIDTFPGLLEKLKGALGPNRELSIAVAGKLEDIDVYKKHSLRIWDAVDFVNVMAYDLMNRRDKVTHHTASVKGANATIQKYIHELALPPSKINLGLPFYAKFFELKPGDCPGPLGCEIVDAETADGADAFTSDYVTFEAHNYVGQPVGEEALDGGCGPVDNQRRCPSGTCCSRYGFCGSTDEFCGHMCLFNFGDCNATIGLDMVKSFQAAVNNASHDEAEGAYWYIDNEYSPRRFFWSWDSPETVGVKIRDIVKKEGLGGVMAWSLSEDNYNWAHVNAIAEELGK